MAILDMKIGAQVQRQHEHFLNMQLNRFDYPVFSYRADVQNSVAVRILPVRMSAMGNKYAKALNL